MKYLVLVLLLLICLPVALAGDYTPTGAQDFTVYADQAADLSGYVYSTVDINESAYPGEEFKCITMVFAINNNTRPEEYIHVQSNPPHINPTTLGIFSPNDRVQTSPEALGYFSVHNGLANVYFRSKDLIAYNQFLYVIKCNSNTSQLTYEETLNPNYKEFGKSWPSRGVWFARSDNADTIVLMIAALGVVFMFIWFGILKRG
jgi:hypothetical protein